MNKAAMSTCRITGQRRRSSVDWNKDVNKVRPIEYTWLMSFAHGHVKRDEYYSLNNSILPTLPSGYPYMHFKKCFDGFHMKYVNY